MSEGKKFEIYAIQDGTYGQLVRNPEQLAIEVSQEEHVYEWLKEWFREPLEASVLIRRVA